jgi:hypothetical protein
MTSNDLRSGDGNYIYEQRNRTSNLNTHVNKIQDKKKTKKTAEKEKTRWGGGNNDGTVTKQSCRDEYAGQEVGAK